MEQRGLTNSGRDKRDSRGGGWESNWNIYSIPMNKEKRTALSSPPRRRNVLGSFHLLNPSSWSTLNTMKDHSSDFHSYGPNHSNLS